MTVQALKFFRKLKQFAPANDKKHFDVVEQALEELEQYRALGTVEGFQSALDSSMEYYNQMKKYKYKLQDYEALGTPTQICERIGALDVELGKYHCLGTVEELKEAREKQVAKKVQKLESKILIADGWQYQCPKCKCAVGINQHAEEQTQEDEYCPTCGQALKWGEEDD